MSGSRIASAETLPQRQSSQIKQRWGDIASEVKKVGRIAVTTNKRIEMVIMSLGEYSDLMQKVSEAESRQKAALDQLETRFHERLAQLRAPDAASKADAVFAAKGRAGTKPKAGVF